MYENTSERESKNRPRAELERKREETEEKFSVVFKETTMLIRL